MSANMATVLAENYQLKWHSHSAHLHSSVSTLYRSSSFTDVTLVTTDGRYLSAHRFVLSACSSYLHRVLQISSQCPTPSVNTVIVLPPEITYCTMAILLQYMYSGEATVSNELLAGVLRAGEVLRIRGLCHNREKRDDGGSGRESAGYDQFKHIYYNSKIRTEPVQVKVNDLPSTSGLENQGGRHQSLLKTVTPTKPPDSESSGDNDRHRDVSREESQRNTPEPKRAESRNSNSSDRPESGLRIEDNMKIELLVKEEPIDWDDQDDKDLNHDDENSSTSHVRIKSECTTPDDEGGRYAPLTCDMCQQTFTTPALWVRHIETHPVTDLPRKRRKRGGSDEESNEYPPLRCELCQEVFTSPAVWVRHIQSFHTEEQLAETNSSGASTSKSHKNQENNSGSTSSSGPPGRETCPSCTKTFPSHASMVIHSRTHTGEKPYICCICEKGFNVKSNLLRHLRTLHDHLINPGKVD